ncbi:hypothetical protein ANCDUO_02942 [Ancylostoma duodenale]|uniref:Uncharacterized protein n=1 Tax=Ancylostoma duodenale TaxID=51022 RepID=A0A0C2GYZ6_9BILA|nr:hypothetical protein ANCDUO_02942 [Ancylostoma duodenale]
MRAPFLAHARHARVFVQLEVGSVSKSFLRSSSGPSYPYPRTHTTLMVVPSSRPIGPEEATSVKKQVTSTICCVLFVALRQWPLNYCSFPPFDCQHFLTACIFPRCHVDLTTEDSNLQTAVAVRQWRCRLRRSSLQGAHATT